MLWAYVACERSLRYFGSLQIRPRWSLGHSSKWPSSLKTMRFQSVQFQIYRAKRHCNRTWWYTGVRVEQRNVWYARRICSLSRLSVVVYSVLFGVTCRMVDNDESGKLTADLRITVPSRSYVVLGQLLLTWRLNLPLLTHSRQHRLTAASLRPRRPTILRFAHSTSFNPM